MAALARRWGETDPNERMALREAQTKLFYEEVNEKTERIRFSNVWLNKEPHTGEVKA